MKLESLHDPARVGLGDRLGGLEHPVDRGRHWDGAPRRDQLVEGRAIEVLEHEVRGAPLHGAHVEDAHHVLARQRGRGLPLAKEPLDDRRVAAPFGWEQADVDARSGRRRHMGGDRRDFESHPAPAARRLDKVLSGDDVTGEGDAPQAVEGIVSAVLAGHGHRPCVGSRCESCAKQRAHVQKRWPRSELDRDRVLGCLVP